MPRILTYRAKPEDGDVMVRDVIKREFRLVAHDMARAKYSEDGGITVDGERVMVNRRLRPGETLRVILPGEEPGKIVPAEGPLEILYEDEDVLCVNKPAGVVVHPAPGHFDDTIANRVALHYIRSGEPHEVRTAGRLDKDTSGVLLFGKSRTACAHLAGQTGPGPAEKLYVACASGIFSKPSGTIERPISREYEEKIRRVVREDGDYAVTRYEVLRQFPAHAVLLVSIGTGRTHQIRVHMEAEGHPLIGDPIYNRPGSFGSELGRAALHAWRVRFRQPFSGRETEAVAPVPRDMAPYVGILPEEATSLFHLQRR